jgi:hypothetical protein
VPVASRQPGPPKMAATVAAPRDEEDRDGRAMNVHLKLLLYLAARRRADSLQPRLQLLAWPPTSPAASARVEGRGIAPPLGRKRGGAAAPLGRRRRDEDWGRK